MNNLGGWGLTARLIGRHFGTLGECTGKLIARFDPETATDADRNKLQASLRETAQKVAAATAAFNKEHDDLVRVDQLNAGDEKVLATLPETLPADSIKEQTGTVACDELEAYKLPFPVALHEESAAKEFVARFRKVLDALAIELTEFDTGANRVKRTLAAAEAKNDLRTVHVEQQSQIAELRSLAGHSTALDFLTRCAQQVAELAEGISLAADLDELCLPSAPSKSRPWQKE